MWCVLTPLSDYIQSLQDDNRISCEKIGSGNWYWSFPSEQAKNVESAYAAAEAEFDRVNATTLELKNKLDERASAIQAEMDAAESDGPDRGELETRKLCLTEEIENARKESGSYKYCDPTELENMKKDLRADYDFAEMATDDIYSMESWFKKQGADEAVQSFPEQYYKPLDQWNEEEGGFNEETLDLDAIWANDAETDDSGHAAVMESFFGPQ